MEQHAAIRFKKIAVIGKSWKSWKNQTAGPVVTEDLVLTSCLFPVRGFAMRQPCMAPVFGKNNGKIMEKLHMMQVQGSYRGSRLVLPWMFAFGIWEPRDRPPGHFKYDSCPYLYEV
jgi:hypothetical protein